MLERTLATFGPDRVMVGTIAAVAAGLPEAEQRAVLSGTAERVYRL